MGRVCFLGILRLCYTNNNTDHHDDTKILLKVWFGQR